MIITYVETYIYKPEAHINDGLWFKVLTPLSTIFQFHSVLLVEETRVPGEHHRPAVSHWQTWSYNVVSSTARLSGILTHNIVVIGTDCIGNCKSKYHTISATMAPHINDEKWIK